MARSTEMGEERRTAFVDAFRKWTLRTFLDDKRTLAFITHGGMGGVFESAYAGVPVITIPLFADQLRNARMMEYRGMGVVIDKDDVTTSRLTTAINEILKPR
ncbi:hypothetical protein ANCCEY_00455 [Ancylostoma ceylanicum]|uniref:glucuronosyltransferase n=2 Tax=Ancylostoma ceylanicum TaxID=53326 RepID=A0A0D6MAC5_9BILA|nr:hypothetical protein ANCCEY_00455 [Ancylostoma ceylanicum]